MSKLTILKRHFAVVLFACLAQVPVANAVQLSLQPDPTTVDGLETVSLDLVIAGLGDFGPSSLGAFDLSVGYDTSALSFVGYSLNNLLGDLGSFEAIDASGGDTGGEINLAEVSFLTSPQLDALQPQEFILASLTFDVIDLAIGATTQLSILNGALLSDGPGSALAITSAEGASITRRVPVPLPATPLLLLIGLCSWRCARRAQKIS